MSDSVAALERDVREEVRQRRLDPAAESPEVIGAVIDDVVAARSRDIRHGRAVDPDGVRKALLDRITGWGDLQPLLDDPEVEEVWINGPGKVFCARNGRHVLTNITLGPDDVRILVERMLRSSGRRIDASSPFVDATLADGSRLHVVIPNITRSHWAVNIRKFVLRQQSLEELVRLGSLTRPAARFLWAAVQAGLNIVVSGGTQAGKTTMLNCLATAIPRGQRVITCEEVFELRVDLPDVVSMQTRPPNVEGSGAIDLRRLIVEALRMRPDRIIVGEVREREALDLLVALNSGLPGMTSVHANSAVDALTKLTTLPLLAGENVTHGFVLPTVASTMHLLVHLEHRNGRRRVAQIVGTSGRVEGARIESVSLWDRDGERLRWTGHRPPYEKRFEDAGFDLGELLE